MSYYSVSTRAASTIVSVHERNQRLDVFRRYRATEPRGGEVVLAGKYDTTKVPQLPPHPLSPPRRSIEFAGNRQDRNCDLRQIDRKSRERFHSRRRKREQTLESGTLIGAERRTRGRRLRRIRRWIGRRSHISG